MNSADFVHFQDAHSDLREGLLQDLEPLRQPLPHALFHYTTAQGLINIISTDTLWATDIRYMNDFGELHYAQQLIETAIEERRRGDTSACVLRFLDSATRALHALPDQFGIYAICFCEEENQLAQWREYGQRGGGYAIGFKSGLEKMLKTKDGDPIMLLKVTYDKRLQQALIDRFLDQCCTAVDHEVAKVPPAEQLELLQHYGRFIAGRIVPYLTAFKHTAFAVEREWRAIVLKAIDQPGALSFREAAGCIAPYKTLHPNEQLPIEVLVQGPHIEPELGKRSLQLLLAQHNYADVPIFPSGITLRKA